MTKILIAECKQEVSTFNPQLSGYEDFVVRRGEELLRYHRSVRNEIGGALNVFARDLRPLAAPSEQGAEVIALAERAARRHPDEEEAPADGALADFREVAPAVQSFAAGRRR